jgi:hypothetical protein
VAEKGATDWEAIERDYRAGLLSAREIGAAHGVSHTAVNKRAKKHAWVKDLTAKIQAKADELVSRQQVSKSVSKVELATERQIIEANAQRIAQVRGEHRSDISRCRTLVLALLQELEGECAEPALLGDLGDMMREPDKRGTDKLNDLYMKIIAHPTRVDSMKKLAETLRILVGLEREAYGLVSAALPPAPPESSKDLSALSDDELSELKRLTLKVATPLLLADGVYAPAST